MSCNAAAGERKKKGGPQQGHRSAARWSRSRRCAHCSSSHPHSSEWSHRAEAPLLVDMSSGRDSAWWLFTALTNTHVFLCTLITIHRKYTHSPIHIEAIDNLTPDKSPCRLLPSQRFPTHLPPLATVANRSGRLRDGWVLCSVDQQECL